MSKFLILKCDNYFDRLVNLTSQSGKDGRSAEDLPRAGMFSCACVRAIVISCAQKCPKISLVRAMRLLVLCAQKVLLRHSIVYIWNYTSSWQMKFYVLIATSSIFTWVYFCAPSWDFCARGWTGKNLPRVFAILSRLVDMWLFYILVLSLSR